MPRKPPKPVTALAKADAAVSANHRKTYPQWDDDAARYGVRVADYNAGFIAGDDNGREALAKAIIPVFQSLSVRVKGQWTNEQRRAWERAYGLLRKHAKR
jgi:hypothetical protein